MQDGIVLKHAFEGNGGNGGRPCMAASHGCSLHSYDQLTEPADHHFQMCQIQDHHQLDACQARRKPPVVFAHSAYGSGGTCAPCRYRTLEPGTTLQVELSTVTCQGIIPTGSNFVVGLGCDLLRVLNQDRRHHCIVPSPRRARLCMHGATLDNLLCNNLYGLTRTCHY